jgi:hypothetical protein
MGLLRTDVGRPVASGVRPSAFTTGHDAEEFDKRLTAALIEAHPAIFLDNFNSKDLCSDILASVLTESPAVPAMPNGRCRLHGGRSPGAPKGNRNAFKHGRYSAERIEARRHENCCEGFSTS